MVGGQTVLLDGGFTVDLGLIKSFWNGADRHSSNGF
jgi:hypothetical protein